MRLSLQRPSTRGAGFTLLEMLVVLAILAILTPIIYSFAGRLTARQQLEEGSQSLVQALNDARNSARKTSRDSFVRLDFDTVKNVYRVRLCSGSPLVLAVAATGATPAVVAAPAVTNATDCTNQGKWKDTLLPNTVKVFRLTGTPADLATTGEDENITYVAPYSRVSVLDLRLDVRSKNYPDLTSKVNVLGVTGKVNKLDRL